MLRDHVKSLEHSWDEAAFVPDVADVEGAAAVAARFLELRGGDFTGGLVLRPPGHDTGARARPGGAGRGFVRVTPKRLVTEPATHSAEHPDAAG